MRMVESERVTWAGSDMMGIRVGGGIRVRVGKVPRACVLGEVYV